MSKTDPMDDWIGELSKEGDYRRSFRSGEPEYEEMMHSTPIPIASHWIKAHD